MMTGLNPRVAEMLKFGTNGWVYEEWRGSICRDAHSEDVFKRDCLGEYARYRYRGRPLFRTVELGHTLHCPLSEVQLGAYLQQVPEGFEICSKVWEEITTPWYPNQPHYGAKAGQANTQFLNARLFQEEVLSPYRRTFTDRLGPFIFEFPQAGMVMTDFLPRLDEFLKRLPKDFRYAVEMKNDELLGPAYAGILRSHGVAHVFTHCAYMPSLLEQHGRLDGRFSAPFVVFRLMTPRARKYSEAVTMGASNGRLVKSLPRMRNEVVGLIRQALGEGRRVYVIVHNGLEGSALMTIQALADLLEPGAVFERAGLG